MTEGNAFAMTAEEDAALAAEQASQPPEGDDGDEGTTEGAEGAEAAQQGDGKPQKTVPHQALHAEREEHKKTRADLAEERRQRAVDMARMDERLKAINERIAPAKEQDAADEMPDPDLDPVGALKFLREERHRTAQRQQEGEQQTAQQRQTQDFANTYVEAVADYGSRNPDFKEAYNHVVSSRATELKLLGMNPGQIKQAIANEELGLAFAAIQAGEHPGDRILALAKHRGWAKKAPAGDDGEAGSAAAELDRIAAGQKGGKSLSQAGGAAGGDTMTAQRLLKMDGDEFDAWMTKHPKQARELMGA